MSSDHSHDVIERRDDIVPVVLGGDVGIYAMGREFYEAFGVRTIDVCVDPINIIGRSEAFEVLRVKRMDAQTLLDVFGRIARQNAGRQVVIAVNADIHVARMLEVVDRLPESVHALVAPGDAVRILDDKASFARLAHECGVKVPRTMVAHVGGEKSPEPWDGEFPVVVKPAKSAEYVPVRAKGFDKVYLLDSQAQVDDLLRRLREAGFAGDMLVQQVVAGDDTCKRSLTLYIDREGRPILNTGAQVLLEDHTPTMIGNPVTMVTRDLSQAGESALRMLKAVGWYGPANFDLKVDPRTGETYVFECNPRLGRNSYYVSRSAVNPMWLAVRDCIDHEAQPLHLHRETTLYSVVPPRLALRYLPGELGDEARELMSQGRLCRPTMAPFERDIRRNLIEAGVQLNYYRKFKKYYPRPTMYGI